jgi:tRNA isopentenyl-2-thiomethyl-A-37 hydroxylase MiaE
VNKNLLKAIKEGISTVAGLPIFAEFLPYAALANTGISIFGRLAEILERDDAIVKGHDLDLHFKRIHAKLLQSGRIVCVPGKNESDFRGKYTLRLDNRLVKIDSDDEEYKDSTYFVMQVNNERNDLYENFDYFQNAASLLSRTNRGDDPRQFVDSIVSMAKGYNDIKSMEHIERLVTRSDEESKKMMQALYNSMSSDMQILYSSRVKELLG